MADRWNPGDAIVLRTVHENSRVGMAMPVTVVEDREDLIALYLAPGTVGKRRAGQRGGPRGRQLIEDTGRHEDWIWQHNRRLILSRPSAGHFVSLFWRDADGDFLDWYIDIAEPLRRSRLGFHMRDLTLDVVIWPDGTWELKDEDELAWAVEHGHFTPEQGEEIRAEAARAIQLFQAGDSLFSEQWLSWRPDPLWTIPQIPEGWDRA